MVLAAGPCLGAYEVLFPPGVGGMGVLVAGTLARIAFHLVVKTLELWR